MEVKYSVKIDDETIGSSLKRLTNQVYKLLPTREEGIDWEKPLETIMEELAGMGSLFIGEQRVFFPLLCKLEGLFCLTSPDDFPLFRRTIFECLGLISDLKKDVIGNSQN